MMGIDKARFTTPRHPTAEFFDELNVDYCRPDDQRTRYRFGRVTLAGERGEPDRVTPYCETTITTRPGVEPFFFLQLNFYPPGGKEKPRTILECNPNKFEDGYAGLCRLIDRVFSDDCADLRLSRIDLNAEVDGISVDYFRRSLRIPGKRKSGEVANADLWTNRGVETFYVGRSPSRLRVYDKCQELKYRGVNVEAFPRTLTRIEWEYRHDHCPVKMFSDLPLLRECEAFRGLQLLECPEYYDFRAEPRGSLRRYTYNRLTSEYGAQDGARIFNHDRHFWRSFKPFMVDNEELKQRIQDSYTYTTNLFFENRGADVRFVYGAA